MKKIIIGLFICLLNVVIFAKTPKAEVSFSPSTISLNDLLEVKITLENLEEQDVIISTTDFNNLGRYSFQSQIAIVNGEITQKKILYYKLQPLSSGKISFTVIINAIKKGPFIVEVIQGNSPTPNLLPSSKAPRSNTNFSNQGVSNFFKSVDSWENVFEDVIIKNIISKKKIKLNEIAILETFIYFRVNYEKAFMSKKFSHQGINLIPLTRQVKPDEQEKINGKIYKKRLVAKYLFYPYQTGRLAIKEGSYQVENSIGFLGRKRVKEVTIPSVNLLVEDYFNPPKGFDNNWGDFKINYRLNQTRAEIGTPLVLYVTVRGEGNFNILYPFLLNSPNLTIKEGQTQEKLQLQRDTLIGEKTFEYFIISSKKGNYQIPPIAFTSYSPVQKKYINYQQDFPELEFYGEEDDSFALVEEVNPVNKPMQFIETNFAFNKSSNLILNPWVQHFLFASFFLTFLAFYQKKTKAKKAHLVSTLKKLKKSLKQRSIEDEKKSYQMAVDELYLFLRTRIDVPFKTIKELKKIMQQEASFNNLREQKSNTSLLNFITSKIEDYEKIIYSPNKKKRKNFIVDLEKLIEQLNRHKN